MPRDDSVIWSESELDALRRDFAEVYESRTCLVTGADGFMGSHLTDAVVELGADVVAFVRATSSGALNNIGHLRPTLRRVVFADLTDKTSIDYLVRDLAKVDDKPYVFHLGAQAHVGESWHRPYETVVANTLGTLNLLQSIVDHGLELEKFDTAGTSEEYGNVREAVAHHHDYDELGGLILHERSPINPKSIYATSKVAADFLTMNYHDAYGIPAITTRMFNNYGPRQNPRYVTGTIITQALSRPEIELGALEPLRDFCFTTDGVRGHLTVAAKGVAGALMTRALVTGGGGFLGSHLVERLEAGGHDVFVARRRDYDLTRYDDAERLFEDARPELVFHLAAEVGGIGANRANPGRYWYANLMMGAHVLEQARLAGTRKVVVAGTVCAYPKVVPIPFREDDLWNGYPEETNAPYGVAKKMMLVQSQSYREQYGFNSIFLLPANLFGPGDNFDLETSHVIPALIRKCVAARRSRAPFIEAWGSGEASREFLYVEDCAEGILLAARDYDESAPVNLGTGREVLIRDLVAMIARLTGFEGEVRWQKSKPDGQPRRQLDVTRAFEKFGFRAQISLEEGLRRTIEWYEAEIDS